MNDALTYLRERREELSAALVSAIERANMIRGGIAEIEYAIEQIEARAKAEEKRAFYVLEGKPSD
jgi:hypothetical protein